MMNPVAGKLSSLSAKQISQVYRNVFGTIDGQLVLEDLKFRCHVYVPSFEPDSHQTAFNEGQRSVVLTIESQMRPDNEEEK